MGGALEVSLINEFNPSAGQTFDILDWSRLSGSFASIQLLTLTGLQWELSKLYTDGSLSVAPVFAADFEEDSDVDGDDLTRWRTGFGVTSAVTH